MKKGEELGERASLYLLILIIAAGAVLRLYELGEKSLWVNEMWGFFTVNRPLLTMLKDLDYRQPPLFFIFLNPYARAVGANDFLLRLPCALGGILSIWFVYILGNMLFSRREGLLGAFFLALSASHIDVSQDMRQYSFLVVFSLLSSIFFLKMLNKPSQKYSLCYVVFSLLMFYTQYMGLAVVLCHILFLTVISFSTRLESRKMIISVRNPARLTHILINVWLPFFVLLIPAIVLIKAAPDQASGIYPETPPPSLKSFAWFSNEMTTGYTYRGAGIRIFYLQSALVVLGIIGLFKRYRQGIVFLCAMYGGLYYSIFAFLYIMHLTPVARRYVFLTTPICALAIAAGVSSLSNLLSQTLLRRIPLAGKAAPAIVALFFSIIMIGPVKQYYKSERHNISGLANFMRKEIMDNDIAIITPGWYKAYLGYYYPEIWRKQNIRKAATFEEIKDIAEKYSSRRIWIVYLCSYYVTQDERVWLSENARYVREYPGREIPGKVFFIEVDQG